ncbi:MAG: BrnA antitoxin family protein [Candidatus Hydrogenedentes bacterium]|nr:BrnA antitoxin family protein [Candidatus Hydrogenedentota bacterium]
MSAKNSRKKSGTDWDYLKSKSDRRIDFSDIPRLGADFWRRATLRMPQKQESVTRRLDPDVLAWLRSLGRGYQTRINAVLRSYVQTIKKTS